MEHIHVLTDFNCHGQIYPVDVHVYIDREGDKLRWNFICHTDALPEDLKKFEVISTLKREILFNRLASVRNEIEANLYSCVNDFIHTLKHEEIPGR